MGTANALAALSAAIQLTLQLQKIQQLLLTAHAEGRDVTTEELNQLALDDNAARQAFSDAIAAAQAAGR